MKPRALVLFAIVSVLLLLADYQSSALRKFSLSLPSDLVLSDFSGSCQNREKEGDFLCAVPPPQEPFVGACIITVSLGRALPEQFALSTKRGEFPDGSYVTVFVLTDTVSSGVYGYYVDRAC